MKFGGKSWGQATEGERNGGDFGNLGGGLPGGVSDLSFRALTLRGVGWCEAQRNGLFAHEGDGLIEGWFGFVFFLKGLEARLGGG